MVDVSPLLRAPVVTEIASHDQMYDGGKEHYFGVGLSALFAISNAVTARESYLMRATPMRDILDFGCGCGRVTRFLRAGYPSANIWVNDLRRADMHWCVEKLGCVEAADEPAAGSYDLVWLGSVFTHLPMEVARGLIQKLSTALRPNGILLFSVQGRHSFERLSKLDWSLVAERPWLSYGLAQDGVDTLLKGYDRSSYGYVDYPGQQGYGVSIARPEWYISQLGQNPALTMIYFQERAYDDHQDIIGFMRRDILEKRSLTFLQAAAAQLHLS